MREKSGGDTAQSISIRKSSHPPSKLDDLHFSVELLFWNVRRKSARLLYRTSRRKTAEEKQLSERPSPLWFYLSEWISFDADGCSMNIPSNLFFSQVERKISAFWQRASCCSSLTFFCFPLGKDWWSSLQVSVSPSFQLLNTWLFPSSPAHHQNVDENRSELLHSCPTKLFVFSSDSLIRRWHWSISTRSDVTENDRYKTSKGRSRPRMRQDDLFFFWSCSVTMENHSQFFLSRASLIYTLIRMTRSSPAP